MARPQKKVCEKRSQTRPITNRARNLAYKNRAQTLKKKAKELTILCDIPVCLISFGPSGDLETWPENSSNVKSLIDVYKEFQGISNSNNSSVPTEEKMNRTEINIEERERENFKIVLPCWDDDWVNGLSPESAIYYNKCLNSKIEAVAKRIEILKGVNQESRVIGNELAVFNDEKVINFYKPIQSIGPNNFQKMEDFPPLPIIEPSDYSTSSWPLDYYYYGDIASMSSSIISPYPWNFGSLEFDFMSDNNGSGVTWEFGSASEEIGFDFMAKQNFSQSFIPTPETFLQTSPLHEVLLASMSPKPLQYV